MEKYIITLLVDGLDLPMTVKASSVNEVKIKISKYNYDSIKSIETMKDYKLRKKPFNQVMTSSMGLVKTSKRFGKDN